MIPEHCWQKRAKMTFGNFDTNNGPFASTQKVSCQLHFAGRRKQKMLKYSLFVRLEAKPGKEEDVIAFLKQGLELANQETRTPVWFALRIGPTTFAVFDSFQNESDRQAHLNGPIAKALMAKAPELFATPLVIEPVEVLGVKLAA
jgi:quinol monooxygenase YgiN